MSDPKATQQDKIYQVTSLLLGMNIRFRLFHSPSRIVAEDELEAYRADLPDGMAWAGAWPGSTVWRHGELWRMPANRHPEPVDTLEVSWPHEQPQVAQDLVEAFESVGLRATWGSRATDYVIVQLRPEN